MSELVQLMLLLCSYYCYSLTCMLNVYVNYCCGGSFCASTWSPNFAHGDNKVYCIVLYNWQDVLPCTPSSKYRNLSHIRLKHQHFEGGQDFSTESFCSERQLTGLFLSVFSCCVSNVPQKSSCWAVKR